MVYKVIFFLLFCISNIFAQENRQIIDLKQLYKNSLKDNHKINISNNNLIIDDKLSFKIDENKSKCLIGFYCQGNYNSFIILEQFAKKNYDEKKTKKNKILLDELEKQKKHKLNDAMLFQLSLLYFEVLKLKKDEALLKNRISLVKESLELFDKRKKIGLKEEDDLKSWKTELENTKNDLKRVTNLKKKIKEQLSYIAKINLEDKILQDYHMQSKEFTILNETVAFYLNNSQKITSMTSKISDYIIDNNIDIKTLNYLINSKKSTLEQTKKYKKELEKSSEDNIKQGKNLSNEHKPWDSKKFDKVIEEKLPLYINAKITQKEVQDKALLQNLTYTLSNKKIKIKKNVNDVLKKIVSSYKTINNTSISSNTTRKNFVFIKKLYDKANIDMKTLLDSQNSMIISKKNENNSQYDYLENIIMLFYNTNKIRAVFNNSEKKQLETQIF
ncbi:hypothetical protein CPU12_04355 [Malaciobacter molluscorum LMG 25693]|uniref:Uncharacterized protein n=1 Tax=Malaciobacter molluscorum LMG 25693 TaxID=870501 RepID=A0A2G1DJ46_9BACT|nr:hypothetical protein [Malaciobacter molluscorum]AXX91687.1 hypothetical protein AMOL_0689 [Malaciobacter molluscorum LMG 25693]PHO18517.1 hypothetical protein CPU12_04355 [Malaciobacter molluscorum LMG 25693]